MSTVFSAKPHIAFLILIWGIQKNIKTLIEKIIKAYIYFKMKTILIERRVVFSLAPYESCYVLISDWINSQRAATEQEVFYESIKKTFLEFC
jgi:hypothetical protein